jgi:hypothetical protein
MEEPTHEESDYAPSDEMLKREAKAIHLVGNAKALYGRMLDCKPKAV